MAIKNSYPQAGYFSKIRKSSVELDLNDLEACVDCGSRDLIQTSEGFACRECGCVLEFRTLEYHAPYDDKLIHYSTIGTTQIGFKRERVCNANSAKLESMQRLHSTKTYKDTILQNAHIEISRVFGYLNLPMSYKDFAFKKFKEIWGKLKPNTKFRSVEKLVPIVVYASLKLQGMSMSEKELLQISKISKKEFNAFKLQMKGFVPEYANRPRENYILQKILEISEHFELDMKFYHFAKKVLFQFWDSIACTKDDVIAGVISSIAAMCLDERKVTVNSICNRLGIRMSTIQAQVKKNFFDRFKVQGFQSLMKSIDLLKKLLTKLQVIELEERQELKETPKTSEIVEISLGSAHPIFNAIANDNVFIDHQNISYVAFTSEDKKILFAFSNESRNISSIKAISTRLYIRCLRNLNKISFLKKLSNNLHIERNITLIKLEVLKNKFGKGPP